MGESLRRKDSMRNWEKKKKKRREKKAGKSRGGGGIVRG